MCNGADIDFEHYWYEDNAAVHAALNMSLAVLLCWYNFVCGKVQYTISGCRAYTDASPYSLLCCSRSLLLLQEETEEKLKLMDIYNARLTERERRREFVIERNIVDIKQQQTLDRRFAVHSASHALMTSIVLQ